MKKYTNIEVDMRNYLKAGERRALSLNNRGPIKFNKDGTLHKDIMTSYAENGFYIFEEEGTNNLFKGMIPEFLLVVPTRIN